MRPQPPRKALCITEGCQQAPPITRRECMRRRRTQAHPATHAIPGVSSAFKRYPPTVRFQDRCRCCQCRRRLCQLTEPEPLESNEAYRNPCTMSRAGVYPLYPLDRNRNTPSLLGFLEPHKPKIHTVSFWRTCISGFLKSVGALRTAPRLVRAVVSFVEVPEERCCKLPSVWERALGPLATTHHEQPSRPRPWQPAPTCTLPNRTAEASHYSAPYGPYR